MWPIPVSIHHGGGGDALVILFVQSIPHLQKKNDNGT